MMTSRFSMKRNYYLLSLRIINFSADQTSSTAQTLMSTSPSGSAASRTVYSLMSVATPELFFGHETQITPSAAIFLK